MVGSVMPPRVQFSIKPQRTNFNVNSFASNINADFLEGESTSSRRNEAIVLLLWRCLGLLATICTIIAVICVIVAFERDEWEVESYTEVDVSSMADSNGYSYKSFPAYHMLTVNSSLLTSGSASIIRSSAELENATSALTAIETSMDNSTLVSSPNTSTDETVTLALSRQITHGLFSVCDTVAESAKTELMSDGVIWLNDCFSYTSTGPSEYPQKTPERFRHLMTRLSQTCMTVSTICLVVTLCLGLFSFILGQVVACIVTATVCLASAFYLLFAGITMVKRMNEPVSFLDSSVINLDMLRSPLSPLHNDAGGSFIYIWVASGTAMVGGLLWLSMWRLLRADVRTLENPDGEHNVLYDYNRCCRPQQ